MKKLLLFPLILLITTLLAYYCTFNLKISTTIENDINTRAQTALTQQGIDWAEVHVDGRDITLTGNAPSIIAKDAANHLARINGYNLINNQLHVKKETHIMDDIAKTAMNYLINKKIDANHLIARGHGASKPIASNKTQAGRAINRRIEITLEDK
jgi:hypothetical protein